MNIKWSRVNLSYHSHCLTCIGLSDFQPSFSWNLKRRISTLCSNITNSRFPLQSTRCHTRAISAWFVNDQQYRYSYRINYVTTMNGHRFRQNGKSFSKICVGSLAGISTLVDAFFKLAVISLLTGETCLCLFIYLFLFAFLQHCSSP